MFGLAIPRVLAAFFAVLCLGGSPAHAQISPLRYWIPGGPFGFGGDAGRSADAYGDFRGFNAGDATGRYNFSNGFFVGGERGGLGLSGFSQAGTAASFSALSSPLSYSGTQFGYNYKTAGGMPVTFFAGLDTLKYGNGIGSSLAPLTSSVSPGSSAFAGVEFKPTSNLSLSFGAGYTQRDSGAMDSDINSSMLPGESPVFSRFRR